MAATIGDLKADIAELQHLEQTATRQRCKDLLLLETRKVQTALLLQEEQAKKVDSAESGDSAVTPTVVKHTARARPTNTITQYAWDQSDKFFKIYVTLEGIQQVPASEVTSTFTDSSFKLTVSNLNDKDYVCHVVQLHGCIIPQDSYQKIKKNCVLLMLKKQEQNTWPHVTKREDKPSQKKKKEPVAAEKEKDPSAGLMDMLKDMYEDGDDEMKRTISKAWSQSRQDGGPPVMP